jgi:hypothetical protein
MTSKTINQLTSADAERIAEAAAAKAIGFGPASGPVTVDAKEVLLVANRAAWLALEAAGVLRDAARASAELNRRKASRSPSIA